MAQIQQIKQYPETHTNTFKFIKSVPVDKISFLYSYIHNGINFKTEQYHWNIKSTKALKSNTTNSNTVNQNIQCRYCDFEV